MDGFGALPGQNRSPPAGVEGVTPLWRGCGSSSPQKIIEPFETSRGLASLAVSAAGHGRMGFFPPELSCDRVNPRGTEESEPGLGASHSARAGSEPGQQAGCWHPTAPRTHPPTPCAPEEGFASQEGAVGLQRAGTHVPGTDMPRSLVQSSGFGQGTFFRRNIIEQGTD